MTTLLISVTIIASLVQYYFWFWHFVSQASSECENITNSLPFASIVICSHNDGAMLNKNLPHILAQNYSFYEVVVVDHGSADGTQEILQKFAAQHGNVTYTFVAYDRPGKRDALIKGIESARGSIIMLTDADCHPNSEEWLSQMMAPFMMGSDLVLGAAPFSLNDGLLNAFSRWENFITLQLFAAEAIRQRPFMALGRNMGFRKSLVRAPMYEDHDLIGGDDDLFVNRIGKTRITSMVLDPRAHMISPAKETLKSFLHQKRRHVSTSTRYQRMDQIFLFIFAGSTWVQLFGLGLLLICGYWYISLTIYLIRLIGLTYQLNFSRHQPAFNFGWKLPVVDMLYLIYYPFLTLFMLQKPPQSWK